MQKRKLKLNILDITIVAVVICAIVAVFFRDSINNIFSKPEIVLIQVQVEVEESDTAKTVLTIANTVDFESHTKVQAVVYESETKENMVTALLTCNGYKKLGRFYTENGDLLEPGMYYDAIFGDKHVSVTVKSVDILQG